MFFKIAQTLFPFPAHILCIVSHMYIDDNPRCISAQIPRESLRLAIHNLAYNPPGGLRSAPVSATIGSTTNMRSPM